MRIRFLASAFLFLAVYAVPGFAEATNARIAVLTFRPLSDPAWVANLAIFTAALREHGWVEGDNLSLILRSTDGRSEGSAELAAAAIEQSPNVIVTINYPNTKAVAEKTRTIPVVMFGVPNPVGLGFVASLSRPGGNITGVSTQTEDTLDKDLQLIQETRPGIHRLAVVTYGEEPYWKQSQEGYARAAQHLGLSLDLFPVGSATELDTALAKIASDPADALVVSSTPLFAARSSSIAAFAIEHRLPTFTFQTRMARDGLLMSYEADVPEMFRRTAAIVDKILRGDKPGDIPVEQPTKFRFVINLKTARAIGIDIAPSMLIRADEVVE
jgi:putative tryptophan/tyrosine transport system substrate-binding protein